ncbi:MULTISPECIES: serine/threonine-protein kinase [unclassified Corallococcus]|uniref:serine/threonine-protein kinase n=1 Tax=unclassified Corallococcus TaxID=2685029 RepID=UPI001A8DDEE2|nr:MULTISPECIES: serine/threonine-protein kinase [unclassified Corallococcus]MBN9683603.1 serine/threonine protein kinase [Corallococcus sp. NCSPR001]WAS84884.1 serine/threonine-protein kinase [Corallococcus sp. NCRR]
MKTRRIPETGAHRSVTEREVPVAMASTAPKVDPLLGAQLGEFVIQERIGAGGMGVVYRAEHPIIGKQAAIKVLRAELMSPEQAQRLLVEARSVNAIRHPGILDIFNFGSLPDGRPYVVMELLQGQSLAAVLRARGRLDVGTAVWMLDQILSPLGAAHRAGVVHRDLKPANVFMAERPDAAPMLKLVDFGIAKVLQSQEGLTNADGSVLGTPDFMAPEQIRGGTVGPATDLYALGVMAFQMLTGARPFQGDNVQVLFAHIEQAPQPPSSKVEGLPPELDALVLQLLEKDPAKRPASAEEVRQRLKALSLEQPPGALGPSVAVEPKREEPTAPTAPRPPGLAVMLADRRKVVPLAVAAVAGVALLGTGLWWVTRPAEAPPKVEQRLPTPAPPVVKAPEPVVPPAPPAPVVQAEPEPEPEATEEEASETEVKTGLPPLPLTTASEKKLARRLFGLFKQQRARAKDVDAEGELRGKLIHQYRAAADATKDSERTRIHVALDGIEKELTQRIALHDAPPVVVVPEMPKTPPLVLPALPTLPRTNVSEQRLAQRLDKLVAELRKRTKGQDVAPDLTKQVVDIYKSAANATTATERMEVNQALDAWQERLTARFPR